jgi:hypothetical protein
MSVTYGRSTLEIVEDTLLKAATPVFNLSRQDAVAMRIQRRELGRDQRLEAEALLEVWEGTRSQMIQADQLFSNKQFVVSRSF